MGTSSSYTAPTSGGWPAAKRTATRFARQGGSGAGGVTPQQVMGAYTRALGGAAAAAGTAMAARAAAQHLGGFLGAAATRGIDSALRDAGLGDLVGQDTTDVLVALVDLLAGPGATLEEAAARAAMLTVLEAAFGDGANGVLANLDSDGVATILERFLVEYIYQRALEQIGDRLQNGSLTSADARRAEDDIHAYIVEVVQLELSGADTLTLDWNGPDGQALVDRLVTDAYEQLAGGAS